MDTRKTANPTLHRITLTGLLVTFGIVFGDIGTSPLYVMKAIVRVNPTGGSDYILGAVSCIFWTLTIQTTVKYVMIALRADNHGEGGILALYSLIKRSSKGRLYILAAIGAATLVADGVITPAVTVTSAVEGLTSYAQDIPVVPIVLAIIILIFVFQSRGTGSIGRLFGPVMMIWFASLAIFGAIWISECPSVIKALNPYYAYVLLTDYPGWFLVLGAVFLCTTGAEALYSDMGHCGRANIATAWMFVKISLILNYMGQAAWIIHHPGATVTPGLNPFYAIVPEPLLGCEIALATAAAVIAGQALISGSFTIFSEAVNLRFWPRLRIKYPSTAKGQLYIPAINFFLLAGCVATVLIFRTSDAMEAAYGLAITITMLMTTFLLTVYISRRVPTWMAALFLVVFTTVEGIFFGANVTKFFHGGWYTILIAGVIAIVIFVWYNGERMRAEFRRFTNISRSRHLLAAIKADATIPKYASNLVYVSHAEHPGLIESKILYSIVNKQPKRADHYWFLRIVPDEAPDTLRYTTDIIDDNFVYCISIHLGYRVHPKLTVYLRQIVEDLSASGHLDLVSGYPSLAQHDIPGEFRFVVIKSLFSPASECTALRRWVMNLHAFIGRHTMGDIRAFGLDVCNLSVENVPLIINTTAPRRIVKGDNLTD